MTETKNRNDSKVFYRRESILTELLETDSRVKLIYYLWLAFEAVWFAYVIAEYITDPSVLEYDVNAWKIAFKTWRSAILVWTILHIPIISVFIPLTLIKLRLLSAKTIQINSKIINLVFTACYVGFMITFFIVSNRLVSLYRLTTVSKIAIHLETLRLIMKMHSFVTETDRKHQSIDSKTDDNQDMRTFKYPKLSQFLYFLIAPTLVYCDAYPKSGKFQWSIVFWNLYHFTLCILLLFTTFNRFFPAYISHVGINPLKFGDVFLIMTIGFLVSLIAVISAYIVYIHCWYNLFAELTQFGDRHFYGHWWMSDELRVFLRQNNSIVQDWLYYYIYKPVLNRSGNNLIANFAVLLASAIGHEYVLSAMGFVIMFNVSLLNVFAMLIVMTFTTTAKSQSNRGVFCKTLIIIVKFSLGIEVMLLLVSIEWYSRINCPKNNGLFDFLIPRFTSCVSIIF